MILHTKRNNDGFTDCLSTQNVTIYKSGSYNPNLAIAATGRTYGSLTIPTGSKVTHETSHTFTVTGATSITGNYFIGTGGDAPTAAASFTTGSLTINSGGVYQAVPTTTITDDVSGAAFRVNTGSTASRIKHNNGLFYFTGAVTGTYIDCGTSNATDGMYDVTIGDGTTTYTDGAFLGDAHIQRNLIVNGNTASPGSTSVLLRTGNISVGGDFTITNALISQHSSSTYQLDVTGNVIIGAGGTLDLSNGGTQTFGGLIINTGGTYDGTPSGGTLVGTFRNLGGTFTAN